PRVGQRRATEIAWSRNGAAFDLVGPAGKVAQGRYGLRKIEHFWLMKRTPDAKRIQGCQPVSIALDQVGQLQNECAALGATEFGPGPAVELSPGCLYRCIDFCLATVAHTRNDFVTSRVDDLDFTVTAGLPFAVDEMIVFAQQIKRCR